ncbi:MAG TPA: protein kinase [Bryobacteraceae bacterium]|nr:protein kinase [Bryobacteraceae bacterium]
MTATPIENETNHSLTLSHRLAEGSIALPEALRYATMLAEALRQIHDAGRKCGTLQPSGIVLTGAGLELVEPREAAAITPYTAPEILQGRTPDARSDIFAFGAIFYEMVTGRRAFVGDNADALAVSLTISVPPPSGNAAVDHLIGNCLAKDPAVRCPRMQKVILELKLLTFGSLRAEATSRQQVATAALRAETQQLEARMASLVEAHEKAIGELQQATSTALDGLRGQVATLQTELAAAQERAARAEQEHGEHYQSLAAHVEQVEGNVHAMDQRITSGEGKVEVLSQGVTVLQEYEATRMQEFEQALRSQGAEIALVSASQVQTDDLVEGVVAAMELLQSSVFDYSEK